MLALIYATLVPGWRGDVLPEGLPRRVVWILRWSPLVLNLWCVLRKGRTFALLSPMDRQDVLAQWLSAGLGVRAKLALLWKRAALLTTALPAPAET